MMSEEYSISSIAKKIAENPDYQKKLEEGVPQYVNFKGNKNVDTFVRTITKQVVNKNDSLGYAEFENGPDSDLRPTDLGMFVPNEKLPINSNIYSYNSNINADGKLLIGTIFTPEMDYYKENKKAIEAEVEKIQKDKKKMAAAEEKRRKEAAKEKERQEAEIEKRKKEEEEQKARRVKEDERKRLVNGVREFLVMLETNIQNKNPIEILTLQKLENDLTDLLSQKDEIESVKSLELSAEHFVQAYKDCKNNQNLSDSVEDRMLCIWKLFYEILGKSTKDVEAVKKSNQEDKASPFLKAIDEAVVQLQSKPVNQITVSDLLSVENALSDFSNQKFDIDNAAFLEKDFGYFESLCEKIIKSQSVGSDVKFRAEDIWGFFCELQGKTQEELKTIIKKVSKDAENERMNDRVDACINLLKKAISEFHSSFVTNKVLDFEKLLVVDDKLSELLELNGYIKDKSSLNEEKDNLKNIFVDCLNKGIFSEKSSEERFANVLGKFMTLCDGSTNEMDKIRKDNDDKIQEDKKNTCINLLKKALAEFHSSFVTNKVLDFEKLQVVDDKLSELMASKKWIKDASSLNEEKEILKNIFVDWAERGIFSEKSAEKKLGNVLGKFMTLCDGSTYKMETISTEIGHKMQENKKNNLLQKIDDTIVRLQSQVSEKQSQITISDLQDLEKDLLGLKQYSDDFKNPEIFLRWKKYFGELCKDCKRSPCFSKSFAMRVKEIMKVFDFFIKNSRKK